MCSQQTTTHNGDMVWGGGYFHAVSDCETFTDSFSIIVLLKEIVIILDSRFLLWF